MSIDYGGESTRFATAGNLTVGESHRNTPKLLRHESGGVGGSGTHVSVAKAVVSRQAAF